MFKIITLIEHTDKRGSLRVLDEVPFNAKRIYFIDNISEDRGGHRHIETRQVMICSRGSVQVYMNNGKHKEIINLDSPNKALLIEPEDWHQMRNASRDALIVVMASQHYNPADYIHEPYK